MKMKCERSAFEFSVADDNQTHIPLIFIEYMRCTLTHSMLMHNTIHSLICWISYIATANAKRTHTHERRNTTIPETKSKNVHVQHNSWTCAMAHFDARCTYVLGEKKNK